MKFKGKQLFTVFLAALLCIALTACSNSVGDGAELLEEKKYTEAAERFQKAIDQEKDLGEAYRGLGICYWEQEDYKKAGEAFEKALENGAEKTATIYNFLGICELKEGSVKKAAFYFQNGQTKEGADEELLKEMAFNEIVAYEADGDYASAKNKLKDYVEKYPDDERAAKELEFLNTQAPKEQQ